VYNTYQVLAIYQHPSSHLRKILHRVRHPMLIFLFCKYVLHNDVTSCMATSDARRLVAGQHITTGMCLGA